jgi:hypothetical protein
VEGRGGVTSPLPKEPRHAAQIIKAQRLHEALTAEKRSGFNNTGVPGGLDPFVKQWGLEAHGAVHHPMFRSLLRRFELIAPAYAAKGPAERQAWVEKMLKWCEGVIAGSTPIPVDEPEQ